VFFSPTTVTLTGSWAPFAAVITVPTITGKTLGVNGNDAFGFQFFTSAGSDFNARTNSLGLQTIGVDLWGIHIRQGTWTSAAAADYRQRDPGTELALCRRYYQISPGLQGAMNSANNSFTAATTFGSDMRAMPTYSLRNGTAVIHQPSIGFFNVSSLTTAGPDYITVTPSTLLGANVPGGFISGTWAASAEL
jgi:hypothetical protein